MSEHAETGPAPPPRNPPTLSSRWAGWISRLRGDDPLFAYSVAGAVLLVLLGVVGNGRPANDVAGCYARQVREFAAGNWSAAFFHMSPPVVPTAAGLLARYLRLPPFAALKVISGAFFVAGLWPLRRILRSMLPARQAGFGCLLFLASGRLLRYATMGLLDSSKAFFLLLLTALVMEYALRCRWRTAAWIGLAAAGLSLARGEGLFLVPFFALAMWVLPEGFARKGMRLKNLFRALPHGGVLLLVFGMVCAPQMAYVNKVSGFPALDSRQIWRIRKLLPAGDAPDGSPVLIPLPARGVRARATVRPEDKRSWSRNAREALKGLGRAYVVLGILGLAALFRRRKLNRWDALLAAVVLYNAALFAANGFITKRYTTPTSPFLIPWVVHGLFELDRLFLARLHRKAFAVLFGILLLAGVWKGLAKVRPRWPLEPNREKVVGKWILEHKSELAPADGPRLRSHPVQNDYHDGRRPIVAATTSQYSFWAEADWVWINTHYLYSPEAVRDLFRKNHVELLVVDPRFRETCPDFELRSEGSTLRLAKDFAPEIDCQIWRVGPKESATDRGKDGE